MSVSALVDLRELRREVDGVSASASALEGGFGWRLELSPALLRPPLERLEGWGVAFSSMGSDGGLVCVSEWPCARALGTDPEEDMAAAALPFAFLERVLGWGGGSWASTLERLLRAPRAGGASAWSGWSGEWSGAADLRLREDGGGGGRAGVGGRAGGEGSVVSLSGLPDWRLCERVTLDDMRF